ncbi:type VI secretion system baseplate subunit TssG [Enterobacter hormaechei]
MLMSVNTETASAQGQTTVLEKEGVYASLFEKINLTPASSLGDINAFLDDAALSDAPAGERLTAAMQVFMDCIRKSGQPVGALVRLLAPDTRTQVYHHDRCRIPLKQPVAMSTCQPVSLKHRPVMGTHATDVNGQVLLRLSTDNPEEIRGWLPGGDLHADLMALLHVWLGAHLDVRMQLCVARHLLPDARLSCNAEQIAQVGRTAVLRPLNPQQNRNDIITIHPGRFQRVRENIQRRKNDEDGDYRW